MSQAGQISSGGGGGGGIPNWNLISTTNISGSPSSFIINSGLTQYNEIMIELVNVASATAAQWSARFSSDGGSTFLLMSCSGRNMGTGNFGVVNTSTIFLNGPGTGTILGADGYIIFDNSPILITRSGNFFITSNASVSTVRAGEGALKTDSPENQIDYIIISVSAGTLSGGTYNVYGR